MWRAEISNLFAKSLFSGLVLSAVLFSACNNHHGSSNLDLPADFDSYTNNQKVDFVVQNVPLDSLAKFICKSAVGETDVKLDLNESILYLSSKLHGDSLGKFSISLDKYVGAMPLPERMRLYKASGSKYADRLGYTVGVEYIADVKKGDKSAREVMGELKAMKFEKANDREFINNFINGFQSSLMEAKFAGEEQLKIDSIINFVNTLK